jgi:hypothetical protein
MHPVITCVLWSLAIGQVFGFSFQQGRLLASTGSDHGEQTFPSFAAAKRWCCETADCGGITFECADSECRSPRTTGDGSFAVTIARPGAAADEQLGWGSYARNHDGDADCHAAAGATPAALVYTFSNGTLGGESLGEEKTMVPSAALRWCSREPACAGFELSGSVLAFGALQAAAVRFKRTVEVATSDRAQAGWVSFARQAEPAGAVVAAAIDPPAAASRGAGHDKVVH